MGSHLGDLESITAKGNAVYQRGIPLEHWKLTSAASNRERGLAPAAPKTTSFFAASTTGKNPSNWVRKSQIPSW